MQTHEHVHEHEHEHEHVFPKVRVQIPLARVNSFFVDVSRVKVRLHTAINWADFVSWCMLYTRTKVTKCIREKMTMCFRQ